MAVPQHEGRLELTWTNKDRRLLSHEDGSYEWTDPGDHRVAEVRLLHDVTAVGNTRNKRDRAKDNLLIRGDALHALTSLAKLPEFRDEYVGKVKLCYIDPPFNTGQAFAGFYDDALEHSVWLTMMRDRLVQVQELLSPDGTVWVHLDDAEVHRARLVLDEVFGIGNFIATLVWEKTTSGRNDATHFSTDQDYILVYASDREQVRLNRLPRDVAADKAYRNPDDDPRGPWREVDYKGPKTAEERPNLYYPIKNPHTGVEVLPRKERVWAYGREQHEQHVADDLLWWGKTGNYTFPKLKRFLNDAGTTAVARTLWTANDADTTRRAKEEIKRLFPGIVPFATPKPERLLRRIIELATDDGDIVLDCFAGSGTTAAVAQKMRRRWVTVEWSRTTIEQFTLPRLSKVVAGEDPGGITAQVGWDGGGGVRVLDVAASMFAVHDSRVVLADWAVDGALGEAVAAQVGFAYSPDPPFTGVKGRTHLAVVDGLVDDAVVTMLAGWLPDGELLTVYGTAVDPTSKETLRSIRRGCTVRKIPQSVLDEYRRRGRSDGLNWPSEAAPSGEAAAPVTVGTASA